MTDAERIKELADKMAARESGLETCLTYRYGEAARYYEESRRLLEAIRKVRDDWVRGDHKCWLDLVALFQTLPEGFTLPERDTAVDLKNCEQYIASCHHPGVTYVSPQVRIEELEAEVAALKKSLAEARFGPME